MKSLGSKNYQIRILVTFMFIILVPLLSSSIVDFFLGFGVLTIGILHGSNDIKIISKNFKEKSNHFFFRSILIYLLVVLLGVVFFFTLPALALLFFVLFSSYHFGEQHWEYRLSMSPAHFALYIVYGAFIFFLMFSIQYESVVEVIQKISGYSLKYNFFFYSTIFMGLLLAVQMIANKHSRSDFLKEVLLLILLGGVFYVGSLLFAFAFYFLVWHSIPSLFDQLKFLYGEMNFNSFLKYLKSSLIYWMASLVTLFLVYRYINFEADYFMPLFFSFLAAITFPHTLVIGMMKHKKG